MLNRSNLTWSSKMSVSEFMAVLPGPETGSDSIALAGLLLCTRRWPCSAAILIIGYAAYITWVHTYTFLSFLFSFIHSEKHTHEYLLNNIYTWQKNNTYIVSKYGAVKVRNTLMAERKSCAFSSRSSGKNVLYKLIIWKYLDRFL